MIRIFGDRVESMKRSLKTAVQSQRVSQERADRFIENGDIFLPEAKSMDPRLRPRPSSVVSSVASPEAGTSSVPPVLTPTVAVAPGGSSPSSFPGFLSTTPALASPETRTREPSLSPSRKRRRSLSHSSSEKEGRHRSSRSSVSQLLEKMEQRFESRILAVQEQSQSNLEKAIAASTTAIQKAFLDSQASRYSPRQQHDPDLEHQQNDYWQYEQEPFDHVVEDQQNENELEEYYPEFPQPLPTSVPYEPTPIGSLSPSLALSSEGTSSDSAPAYYFYPEDAILCDSGIEHGSDFISFEDGTIEHTKHQGKHSFRPLVWTSAVKALVAESTNVVIRTDLRDSRQDHFRKVVNVFNKTSYEQLGWSSSSSEGHTLTVKKLTRAMETLPDRIDQSKPFRPPPFALKAAPDASLRSNILSFSAAPKLSKDCHVLPGLLAGKTREVSDDLRQKDYEARKSLQSLLFVHEASKFIHDIAKENIAKHQPRDPVQKHINSITGIVSHGLLPTTENALINATTQALNLRSEIREKAVKDVKTYALRVTLRGGSLFSEGLFDNTQVKQAEDIQRSVPPPVIVNVGHQQFRDKGGSFTNQSRFPSSSVKPQARGKSTNFGTSSFRPPRGGGNPRGNGRPRGSRGFPIQHQNQLARGSFRAPRGRGRGNPKLPFLPAPPNQQ